MISNGRAGALRFGCRIWCVASLLALAACADLSTEPRLSAEGAIASAGVLHSGDAPLYCTLWRQKHSPQEGWQTRRIALSFPRGEIDRTGLTVEYKLYARSHSGELRVIANCRVPYTESALRRVDRWFRVDRGGGAEQFRSRNETLTTQGCVSDGLCQLEPIVVVAPPDEDHDEYDPCEIDPASCGSGSGSWDDWSGGGGGGSGTAPGDSGCPEDPVCASQEAADDELATCTDLGCDLRDPTAAERQKVLDLINTLRTDGFCAEVRESALTMVNRYLQVWDNRVKYPETGTTLYGAAPWDYERGGHVMYIWTGSLTAWTIAHEAIHGIWNPSGLGHWYTHRDITPLGVNLNDTAKYCSGN